MRQIFLDTETTGLRFEDGNRVIEIGCVEMVNRQLTGNNLHYYLNPERDSEPGALKIHGLTNEFLHDKPFFKDIADMFLSYIAGAELVIHNASFDCGFLNNELARINRPKLNCDILGIVDTLKISKEMFPGKRNSLDALCQRFEINNSHRILHGALLDAELLADVYIHMTRGQDSFFIAGQPVIQEKDAAVLDLSQIRIPIILANEQELSAHDEIWKELSVNRKKNKIT
jgi:DNA polymerase III subunit epsilon